MFAFRLVVFDDADPPAHAAPHTAQPARDALALAALAHRAWRTGTGVAHMHPLPRACAHVPCHTHAPRTHTRTFGSCDMSAGRTAGTMRARGIRCPSRPPMGACILRVRRAARQNMGGCGPRGMCVAWEAGRRLGVRRTGGHARGPMQGARRCAGQAARGGRVVLTRTHAPQHWRPLHVDGRRVQDEARPLGLVTQHCVRGNEAAHALAAQERGQAGRAAGLGQVAGHKVQVVDLWGAGQAGPAAC